MKTIRRKNMELYVHPQFWNLKSCQYKNKSLPFPLCSLFFLFSPLFCIILNLRGAWKLMFRYRLTKSGLVYIDHLIKKSLYVCTEHRVCRVVVFHWSHWNMTKTWPDGISSFEAVGSQFAWWAGPEHYLLVNRALHDYHCFWWRSSRTNRASFRGGTVAERLPSSLFLIFTICLRMRIPASSSRRFTLPQGKLNLPTGRTQEDMIETRVRLSLD